MNTKVIVHTLKQMAITAASVIVAIYVYDKWISPAINKTTTTTV